MTLKLRAKLRKFMPDRKVLIAHKSLRIFGKLIHDPNLWHLNRHSVARAFSVGLFCAWIPVPFQMILAAAGAMLFHANLPLAVALVWTTNPITMPPLFLFAYYLGAYILNLPRKSFHFELSLDWFMQAVQNIWQPFLLGCLICGVVSAILGNTIIRIFWRLFVMHHWRQRSLRRQNHKNEL